MHKKQSDIKKHTFSTVLDDDDNQVLLEAQEKLKISRSELLRRAGLLFSTQLERQESDADGISRKELTKQATRGAKTPKINANFQLPPQVVEDFRAWCDEQEPPWKYGYAVEQAIRLLIKR